MSYKREKLDEKSEQARIDMIRAQVLEPCTDEDEVKYQTIIEYCKQNNTTFHDGEFPLTMENLGKRFLNRGRPRAPKKSIKSWTDRWLQPSTSTWKRVGGEISEEYKKKLLDLAPDLNVNENRKIQVWRAQNEFNVYQNGFKNCALIAGLSAISAHPRLLRFLLRDFEICDYGVYQVKLCMDGAWNTVVIDDWMPSFENHLACSTSGREWQPEWEIWPALLEKGLAKVYGGYKTMFGFSMNEALALLTGAPVTEHNVKDYKDKVDELWEILHEASSNFFPAICATKGKLPKQSTVNSHHAYTLVSCIIYEDPTTKKVSKLIRLRNPWGRENWEGKFSKSEIKLAVVLKDWFRTRLGYIDGTFWMELDEFMDHFSNVVISRYRDTWSEIRFNMAIGGLWDDSQKIIKITVPKACEICVSVIRPNYYKRRYITWISIHQMDPLDSDKIGKIVYCEPIAKPTKEFKIEAGDYFLMISNFYESKEKQERNIVIQSSVEITAKLCNWSPHLLVGVFQKVIGEKGTDILKKNEVNIKKYAGDEFVMVMAENHTNDQYLHVHTQCHKVERCWMSRGNVYNHYFGDVIHPKSRQILISMYRSSDVKQKGFPMTIDYFLSKKKTETKIGRKNEAAHIPEVLPTDYIHNTVSMD